MLGDQDRQEMIASMTGDDAPAWGDLPLDGDPRLILGWRPKQRRLEGQRLNIHEDAFADLREIARGALDDLAERTARPYEPHANLDGQDEYFALTLDEIPGADLNEVLSRDASAGATADRTAGGGKAASSTPSEPTPDEEGNAADLLRLLRTADQNEPMHPKAIGQQRYHFYAICFGTGDSVTAFVQKTDPRRSLKRGRRFFQYHDTLRSAKAPDLVLDEKVSFVIHDRQVAITHSQDFTDLLADVGIALRDVPTNVDRIATTLEPVAPLNDDSRDALRTLAGTRTSLAGRLHRLQRRLGELALDTDQVLAAAKRHMDDPSKIIEDDGTFTFNDLPGVHTFLDLAEGRLFEDDFTGERRRADRWSTRS
ncbi:hypothetical protein [Salinifilum ghardaiensis]